MAYKDKEKAREYYRKYYLENKKPKYVPSKRKLLTKEEKLAKKRDWYYKNKDKCLEAVRKYAESNKEKIKLRNKLWRDKNKERLKEESKIRGREWYKKNKEKNLIRGKIWRENHPENAKGITKRFKDKNPEKIRIYQKRQNIKPVSRYRQTKVNARRRGYTFELTLEQFLELISKPCTYCGESEERIGIDRVDNNIGYIIENATPCCKTCNMMKKNLSVHDFTRHINKIALHNLK